MRVRARRLALTIVLSTAWLGVSIVCRAAPIALHGTVVTPNTVIQNGYVVISGRYIEGVGGRDVVPSGVPVIDTAGLIFPGLIDLHNHITWNAFPRWKPPTPVTARYDWLSMQAYLDALSTPHGKVQEQNACDLERFGEVKAIIGGATSVTGSLGAAPGDPLSNACVLGLARNLDVASELNDRAVNAEPLQYRIFPLEMSATDMDAVRRSLAARNPVVIHLAEGITPSTAREFRMISAQGLLQRGLTIVHGVALGPNDFADMAKAGVGLVWSPRSNLELYGKTTDVTAAKSAKVVIAISPDWSPSGSNGMLDELRYAAALHSPGISSEDLVRMATVNPAALGGVSSELGSIEPGKIADLLIVRPQPTGTPFDALVETRPQDVRLVMIGGRAIYGDADLFNRFAASATAERQDVCGSAKVIDMKDSDNGRGISLATTLDNLNRAFAALTPPIRVSSLFDCN